MLKPFQIRDLHRSPSPSQEDIEQSDSDTHQRRPGIVAVSAAQYNDIATFHPQARLTYIDDDDGELITVGSSLELSQRLDEPVPGSAHSYPPPQTSNYEPMHIFDIRRSTPVIELWKEHEWNICFPNPSAPTFINGVPRNTESSAPGVENNEKETEGDNGATGPSAQEESEPLMAAFEAEMAKILRTSETLDENPPHQDNTVPRTEDQNRTAAERFQIPTESFINAMQSLVHGAETLSSGVRSRLPEIERQLQNAQRAMPCPVGSSMQAALTALEGQAKNLVSAINNVSTSGEQNSANLFPRELPTAADTVESLRSMASELGHMGHTLFETFENELGCNAQGSQNQASSGVAASSATDAVDSAHADDNNEPAESVPSASSDNPAPTSNLESQKEPMSSDTAGICPDPEPSQQTASTESASEPQNHNDGPSTIPRAPRYTPGTFPFPYHMPYINGGSAPRRQQESLFPGAFPPHPPPHPHFPPHSAMGWPLAVPFQGQPVPSSVPPPLAGPPRHHRTWPQFPFCDRPNGHARWNRRAPSHEERPNTSSSPNVPAQTALFIGNVGYNVNDKMIRDVFAAKGFLADVYLPLDSVTHTHAGFGYLHFPSVHAAKAALDGLQGTLIDGHSINLEFSDSSPITTLNTPNQQQQSAPPQVPDTSRGMEQAPSERGPANNGRALPLSVADMCSVNGNASNGPSTKNDSDSSERLNALYPSLVPESPSQRPNTNANTSGSPSDLLRPTELESRFPPVSQLDALFLAQQRGQVDSHGSTPRPEPTADHRSGSGRSASPNIPGAFPEAHRPSVTAPVQLNSQQIRNHGASAATPHIRRSKTVRTSHPPRGFSGPWDPSSGEPGSDRSLRRRATERSSLRPGWSSRPGACSSRPSNGFPVQRETTPEFETRRRSIDDCISTLASLGYGSSEEGGLQRIGVYAAAADGNVTEAIDMIEEERKAYAQRR